MAEAPYGALAALRHPVLAVLRVATVRGNTGNFVRDVAGAWLLTDLSASPAAVAAIQAAVTVPPLLALIFASGIGAALMGPTRQSVVPELVPREDLKGAVAFNSFGINIARSIGLAIGGVLLASFGATVTYGWTWQSMCSWWKPSSDGRAARARRTPCRQALAAGTIAWGLLAKATGIPVALPAAGLIVASVLARHKPLPAGEADLSPSHRCPEPAVTDPMEGDRSS